MMLTIAAENALTDNLFTKAYWTEGIDRKVEIPSFVRSSYYRPGQTAQFSTDYALGYTLDIYRLGWYGGGSGNARKITTIAGVSANQPEAVVIPNSNGAVDCRSWSITNTWTIPNDATPGWYWVVFKGTDNPTDFFTLVFCVTDTLAKKPIVVVSGDSTCLAAYNYYGGKSAVLSGKSLYGSNGPMSGGIQNRALCVSYDRPVVTREGIPQTYFMNAEYPLLRYLERMGLEVGHVTNEQVDTDPTVLDGRSIVIVSGHNEYTSQRVWNKFKSLKASTSTHLINLSGNDFFWRGAFSNTDMATSTGRVFWCDKATMPGPGAHTPGTPIISGHWGGTWQDTRFDLTSQAGSDDWSENLWGDIFCANGIRADNLKVFAKHKTSPMWRDCSQIQSLTSGASFSFGAGTLGMEWDVPSGSVEKVYLSETVVDLSSGSPSGSSDINGEAYNIPGTYTHQMFLMATPGGGVIFNAANVQYSWVLDDIHDRGTPVSTTAGRQGFLNLLVDLGAVPDSNSVTAAGLVNPIPVTNFSTAYGLTGVIVDPPIESTGLEAWVNGAWQPIVIVGIGSSTGLLEVTLANT